MSQTYDRVYVRMFVPCCNGHSEHKRLRNIKNIKDLNELMEEHYASLEVKADKPKGDKSC